MRTAGWRARRACAALPAIDTSWSSLAPFSLGLGRSGSDARASPDALGASPSHDQRYITKGAYGPTGYALAASGTANTPRSLSTSSSAVCQAGATLFLVTWTRTRRPTTRPPSFRYSSGRRSKRTEA